MAVGGRYGVTIVLGLLCPQEAAYPVVCRIFANASLAVV